MGVMVWDGHCRAGGDPPSSGAGHRNPPSSRACGRDRLRAVLFKNLWFLVLWGWVWFFLGDVHKSLCLVSSRGTGLSFPLALTSSAEGERARFSSSPSSGHSGAQGGKLLVPCRAQGHLLGHLGPGTTHSLLPLASGAWEPRRCLSLTWPLCLRDPSGPAAPRCCRAPCG